MATPKAVEVIQLAGELELHRAGEEESDSDSEQEGEECFQEDSSAQGEVILLDFEVLKEHQKGDTNCQSLAQWENATAFHTRDVRVAKMKGEQLLQHSIPSMYGVLSEVMSAYNTSVDSTTGFTPYFLMFGVEARIP